MPYVDMQYVKWTEPFVAYVLEHPTSSVYVSYTKRDGTNVDNFSFPCKDFVFAFLHHLHNLQSPTERAVHGANEHDGKGFNRYDAPFLMSVAESSREHSNLTERQSVAVAQRLKKYKKQIINSVENKRSQKSYNKNVEQLSMFPQAYSRG